MREYRSDVPLSLASSLKLGLTMMLVVFILTPFVAHAQIAPPTLASVTPVGIERGKKATLTIEGTNLRDADRVYFSHLGLKGKVVAVKDLGPEKRERSPGSTAPPIKDLANKHAVTVEVEVAHDTPVGRHSFRLGTPLGASTSRALAVSSLSIAHEQEPNNDLPGAQKISLPLTANGMIDAIGDADIYEFEAKAGQELVFEVMAATLQSPHDSTLTLLDSGGRVVAVNEDYNNRLDSLLAHKFTAPGKYFIRVSEALTGDKKNGFYLLNIGELPIITGFFPLGGQRGTTSDLQLRGHNLGGLDKYKFLAPDSALWGARVPIEIKLSKGELWNRIRAAIGTTPEAFEAEGNDDLAGAQKLSWPVTINGVVSEKTSKSGGADQDVFKWSAKKGQRLSISVAAQRLGSALDSFIEILDARGQVVPRAVVRPLLETYTTLRDHDSSGAGIRLASATGITVDDYLLIDGELVRVASLPPDPDSDTSVYNFMGQRMAYEGTSPTGHALDTPVYKVALYQPGEELPGGGAKPITLTYRNDDGGLMYGKDSYISFIVPEDGEYYLRLKDVRDFGSDTFAYRLTIAGSTPDYNLTANPASPNVPLGGSVPVTVTAHRIDGFDGPINVTLEGLPAGLTATAGTILPGHHTTVLSITSAAVSKDAASTSGAPWRVIGKAAVNGQEVTRVAEFDDPVNVVSILSMPELTVAVEPRELVIEPGGEAKVTVTVTRVNGFEGRVPVSVRNLPRATTVKVGLNGVLITESETSRTFKIEADPRASTGEQLIYVTGSIETNTPTRAEYAAPPIKLRIVPKSSTVADSNSRTSEVRP
ncbi:MAG: PPC domain-containing protein [Acidobacteriota bacterium]|nr:PPC domain-containing protein [Acidobacteriota bacterium]